MHLPPVWNTRETTAYLRLNLIGKRSLSTATVRRWAGKKIIPANRGLDHRWYFEPELVARWVDGGPILSELSSLSKKPRLAFIQIRELVAYLLRPVNQEGNPYFEPYQDKLTAAVGVVIRNSDYCKIRQSVRDLCESFRFNPGLRCLEEVGGLFS